jgi:hypothetical protein
MNREVSSETICSFCFRFNILSFLCLFVGSQVLHSSDWDLLGGEGVARKASAKRQYRAGETRLGPTVTECNDDFTPIIALGGYRVLEPSLTDYGI